MKRLPPGKLRDTIDSYLKSRREPCLLEKIYDHVQSVLGEVPPSSVRSSLNNRPRSVERVGRGLYRLRG